MASPFSVFRSNLKPLMVALTLLSLFAFVALPALQMYQQYNVTGGTNPWIARYDGGTFHEDEIIYFNRTHGHTTRFLTAVAEQVIQRGGTPRVPGFRRDPRTGQIVGVGISEINSPRAAVLTKLYANQARDIGLALDDAAIEEWMSLFTDGKLSRNELAGIRAEASQNLLGQSQLFEHLRTELLASVFRHVASAGLEVGPELLVPPTQRWLQFLKLNQEATVTAYPVLVEEFLDRVAEPTEAEIEAIYAEGKERFSNPNSPEPAFRRRYAANVEYVAGVLDDFVQAEVAKLSEEQIRAEYEQRSSEFELPPTPTRPEETPAEETPAEGDAAPNEPLTDAPAVEETTSPEPTETPAPETDPASEENDEAEEASEPQPSEDDGEEEQDDTQSRRIDQNVFRLTALRPQEEQTPSAEQTPGAEAAEDVQEQDVAAPPEEDADEEEQPATDEPQTDEPQTDEPQTDEPQTDEPAATEQPATEQPATEQPADEPAAPAKRPFEEVREEIAESMVRSDARDAMDRAVTEANSLMRAYFTQMAVYEDTVATGSTSTAKKPERPNLQQIAERLGLQYGQTGMKDAVTIRDTAIGRSRGLGGSSTGFGEPFPDMVYDDSLPRFAPVRTVNEMEQTSFVSWKTDVRETHIPELSDIRDEVVAAARESAARKLAQEHAQELASKANAASDAALETLVPENRRSLIFEEVGPFPWLRSFPGTGIRPFIPEIPELDNVGEKFMRAVFTTPVDQYGVGPNNPETVYYVVKPTDFQPPTEELRTRFMQADQRRATNDLAFQDASQIYTGWAEAFEQHMGLEWNEEALQP